MSQKDIASLEKEGKFTFAQIPDAPVVTLEDVEVIPEDVPGWLVANDGNVTVALDVTVTPELKNEGMARELVNRIQNIRKSSDFDITDRITVRLSAAPEVEAALASFGDYIAGQVLADSIEIDGALAEGADNVTVLDIDGLKVLAEVKRV